MTDPGGERNLRLTDPADDQRRFRGLPERARCLHMAGQFSVDQDGESRRAAEDAGHMDPLFQRQRRFGYYLLPHAVDARAEADVPERIDRERKAHLLKLTL